MLPRDFQYGEIIIPKGSLVERYSNLADDEMRHPIALTLSHLESVRFVRPIQIGGVWATAMKVSSFTVNEYWLELAQDQELTPRIVDIGSAPQHAGRLWEADYSRPPLHCPKGYLASFSVVASAGMTHLSSDAYWEQDGEHAYFLPSRWGVSRCWRGDIVVSSAYTGTAPWGASAPVWTAESLQPRPYVPPPLLHPATGNSYKD